MPPINYRVHQRQFYIGSEEKLVNETWKSRLLNDGMILSHCKTLPVEIVEDQEQNQWVLIGDAVQSLAHEPAPQTVIQQFDGSADIQEKYASWAGRWVLIGMGALHLDASGLLGCYYRQQNNRVEVASSAVLISGREMPETFPLIKAGGAEFYPPPDSGFKGLSKLLPSQILELPSGALRFRNLTCKVPPLSYAQTIGQLAMLLTTALKNAYGFFDSKVYLALTGGHDSRAIMAALNKAAIPYEAITFHGPLMRPSDSSVPRQLCKISGIPYHLVKRRSKQKEHKDRYNLHTTRHSVEGDREFMMYQQFDFFENSHSLLLRGGGFEVGRCAYYPWLPAAQLDGQGISRIQKGNTIQGHSWDKWVHWIKMTPQIQLDWRDRYYIEQRLAGWLSATEQGLDLVNINRFVPANSQLFYSLMLQIPEEIRKTKIQMIDLIRELSPELLGAPINPKEGFWHKQYRKILFKVKKIQQQLSLG